MKSWLLSTSFAKIPTVLVWLFFSPFSLAFVLVTRKLFIRWSLGPCVLVGRFLKQRFEILIFHLLWNLQMVFKKTHVYRRSIIFCISFRQWWNFDFAPAHGITASVHGSGGEDYIKVKHVKTLCANSKFPTVITLTIFFFRSTF